MPSNGCEMLARAREREREREYPLMMSWERWPPHAIHRLPQKLPQVPTLDSSATRPADHDQPTHSVRWLTSTGCFSSVGDVRLRPNFPQWKPGYDRGKEPPEACAANTAQLAQSSRQSRLASNPLLLLKASFSPQSPPPLGALVSHSGSLAPSKVQLQREPCSTYANPHFLPLPSPPTP